MWGSWHDDITARPTCQEQLSSSPMCNSCVTLASLTLNAPDAVLIQYIPWISTYRCRQLVSSIYMPREEIAKSLPRMQANAYIKTP